MDTAELAQYRTLCRGAAMYILLGRPARAKEALECVKLSRLNLTTVSQDVAAIVQAARQEIENSHRHSARSGRADQDLTTPEGK
jgi:hypothetical protein